MNCTIISDPLRSMITAERMANGRIALKAGKSTVLLSDAEIERLYDFAVNRAIIQRFPVGQ